MPEGAAIRDLKHLREMVGREVATSDWLEVTQERINQFAEATGDHQWIHVDPQRAAKDSPYKTTIAHGFLTLSLLSPLAAAVRVPGLRFAINYGLEKLRFVSAVPAGSRIRARFTLRSLDDGPGGAIKAHWSATVECEGSSKPACVAEWLLLYYE